MTIPKTSEARPGSFTELYYQLGHAIAKTSAIPAREKKKQDRAVQRCDDIGRRLLLKPAKTLDDMLTKIMVAGYFSDCVTPVKFGLRPNWEPGPDAPEEILALASLRGDIWRLKRWRIAP